MLVIFNSKAGADIMMFEENAKQILDLFGKETEKGIITSDETEAAIATLEKEIARRKQIEAEEKAERERQEKEEQAAWITHHAAFLCLFAYVLQ